MDMTSRNTVPSFEVETTSAPISDADRERALEQPGFGTQFTDHMITIDWSEEQGWHAARVQPFGPLPILPGASALQYGQQGFEGIKAYRHADGSVWTFRPERNAARLRATAERFYLTAPDDALFVESLRSLVAVDHEWVPQPDGEKSLYLRPFIIGTEQFLGVRPSKTVTFGLIAGPSGIYVGGLGNPVNVWLSEEHVRATIGGTGEAKCGGNYAAGLGAHAEAKANGCQQTLFLDAETRTYVEEFTSMNVLFVTSDGHLVTPDLSGTILHGITRASLLQIAAEDLGMTVEERRVSVTEWRERVADGSFSEVFACGTAAVITPIGILKARNFDIPPARHTGGEVTQALKERLTGIQYGHIEDTRGWMVKLRD